MTEREFIEFIKDMRLTDWQERQLIAAAKDFGWHEYNDGYQRAAGELADEFGLEIRVYRNQPYFERLGVPGGHLVHAEKRE